MIIVNEKKLEVDEITIIEGRGILQRKAVWESFSYEILWKEKISLCVMMIGAFAGISIVMLTHFTSFVTKYWRVLKDFERSSQKIWLKKNYNPDKVIFI